LSQLTALDIPGVDAQPVSRIKTQTVIDLKRIFD